MINGDSYSVAFDNTNNTVNFKGSLRLENPSEYRNIEQFLIDVHELELPYMNLDFQDVEFLNSSGIPCGQVCNVAEPFFKVVFKHGRVLYDGLVQRLQVVVILLQLFVTAAVRRLVLLSQHLRLPLPLRRGTLSPPYPTAFSGS